jgi:hypothetical protein
MNPDMGIKGYIKGKLIPNMLDSMVRLVVDPLFPPPEDFPENKMFS